MQYRYFHEGQFKVDPTTGTKCRTGQLNHQFVEQKFVGGVWIGIGDNNGVRYGDVAGVGCRFREGMLDCDYVVDVETEVAGFLLAEGDGWVNCGEVVGWTPEILTYMARVNAGGGTIGDIVLLKDEMKYVTDNNLFNKIGYWVDNDLGKFVGNPALKVPLISFSFDDGKSTDYTVYQSFVAKGIGMGTTFINTKFIGTADYLTWAQVAEMLAGGWDFQCHTWSHAVVDVYGNLFDLTQLTNAEIVSEVENLNADFIAHGLPSPIHHAYHRYVADFTRVLPIVGKYRRSMRGGANDYVTSLNYEKLSWWSHAGTSTSFITDIAALKTTIDLAILHKQILHLPGHSSAAGGYIAGLETILDYIYAAGLTPKNVSQYYAGVNAYRNKLFNVIEGADDGSLKNYEPIVYLDSGLQTDKQGIIIFNDTLANIGSIVADHFVNNNYRVGFWTDDSVNALAYTIPNNIKYLDQQSVIVDSSIDKIVFTFAVENVGTFQSNSRIYLTGITAPGNLAFNTTYFIKSFAGAYAFKLSASSGGAQIDITDAVVGVKCSTYGFRDAIIAVETAANCTPEKLAKRTVTYNMIGWNCGGNLEDCGVEYFRSLYIASEIYFDRNFLGGTIPKAFRMLGYQCKTFSFRYNKLTGGLINLCNNIYSLLKLDVGDNLMNEEIPDEIGNLRNLSLGLYLGNNLFFGSIPRTLGNLTKVLNFNLYGNLLSGIIPIELGLMIKVVNFNLYGNLLSGYEAGAISVNQTVLAVINFSTNALPASAINQILADTLALHIVSGTVITLTLTGGTNAAPTGQGATDKAALITHGCTVTTN